jgi:hypothetical protein
MTRFITAKSCRLTELPDQTGVVLHLERKFYFTLNPTAVFVYKALRDDADARTGEALAARLADVFEVDLDTARADVIALLEALELEGIVEREPSA